jgi:hypothetical protein
VCAVGDLAFVPNSETTWSVVDANDADAAVALRPTAIDEQSKSVFTLWALVTERLIDAAGHTAHEHFVGLFPIAADGSVDSRRTSGACCYACAWSRSSSGHLRQHRRSRSRPFSPPWTRGPKPAGMPLRRPTPCHASCE